MNNLINVSNNPEIYGKQRNIMDENFRILNIKDLKLRYGIGNDAVYALVRQKDFPSFFMKGRFLTREDKLLEWEEKQMSAPKKYMQGGIKCIIKDLSIPFTEESLMTDGVAN